MNGRNKHNLFIDINARCFAVPCCRGTEVAVAAVPYAEIICLDIFVNRL